MNYLTMQKEVCPQPKKVRGRSRKNRSIAFENRMSSDFKRVCATVKMPTYQSEIYDRFGNFLGYSTWVDMTLPSFITRRA